MGIVAVAVAEGKSNVGLGSLRAVRKAGIPPEDGTIAGVGDVTLEFG